MDYRRLLLAAALGLGSAQAMAVDCPPSNIPSAACRQQRLASANAEEQQVYAIVDRLLAYLRPPAGGEGGFELNRNYALSKNGNRYQASFLEAAFVADKTRVEFGPLLFDVQPLAGGRASVSLKIGNAVVFKEDGKEAARLAIGEQDTQAVWDDKLENFAQGDWRLGKLSLELVADPSTKLTLSEVKLTQAMSRAADDTWKQDSSLAASGLGGQIGGLPLSLARVDGSFNLAGQNYRKFLELSQYLSSPEFQAKLQTLEKTAPAQQEQTTQEVMAKMAELYQLFGRFDSRLSASDLVLGDTKQPMARLARLNLISRFDDQQGKGSQLGYTMEMQGLQTQAPGIPANLLPNSARFELGVTDIPANIISRIIALSGQAAGKSEEESQALMTQELMALLATSKLGVYIKDSHITAQDARLTLDAQAQVDSQAAMGGTGELKMRIEGLQKVIDGLGEMAKEQGTAQTIAMLMMFSSRSEENGKVVDSYDLKLGKDGQITLNGKDMSALFAAQPGEEETLEGAEAVEGEQPETTEGQDSPPQTAE